MAPSVRGARSQSKASHDPHAIRADTSCVWVRGRVERVEFYARASRNQAQGIAKAPSAPRGEGVAAEIFTTIFYGVGFSTGFARVIHRISTSEDTGLPICAEK